MEGNLSKRPGERTFIWLLVAFSVAALIEALRIPQFKNLSSPGVFPIIISTILLFCSLHILWKNRTSYSAFNLKEELLLARCLVFPRSTAVFMLALIIYILLLYFLHFWASSYLFLVGSFFILKGTTIGKSFIIAASTLVFVYLVFEYIFKVMLW